MPVNIPTEQYDLAAFGLLVAVAFIFIIMIGVRMSNKKYHSVEVPLKGVFSNLMNENAWTHTALYIVLLCAIVASAVLVCSS